MRSPLTAGRRLAAAGAMAVAGGVAVLAAASLAASTYGRLAERGLTEPYAARPLAAARIASSLNPWSGPAQALHGWILAERKDGPASAAAYRQALAWHPGDPLLWSEFALALARTGQFGDELLLATARANALSPTSPTVQQTLATMGLSYWARGIPALRQQWLQSLRFELDRDPEAFRDRLIKLGYWRSYCAQAASALGEQPWCDGVQEQFLRCKQPGARPGGPLCDWAG
ncbi:MAG TPA: hypothetical protein VM369_02410 [Candidatus Binatia bacterium]|nr:hypothetical protein [Candidatus Binatia bacterium]